MGNKKRPLRGVCLFRGELFRLGRDMPSGGLFRKSLGVERDILHAFDFAVETCGGTQVVLLFGGGNAVTGVIDEQAPVRCMLGNAGVIGEEFAALCGHTAHVSVEIGVADESVDEVLVFQNVMFLMLILFFYLSCSFLLNNANVRKRVDTEKYLTNFNTNVKKC